LLAQITQLRTEVADVAARQQAAEAARLQADHEIAQLKVLVVRMVPHASRSRLRRDEQMLSASRESAMPSSAKSM
jgi:hypothetical protein